MIERLWRRFWRFAGAVSVRWKVMGIVVGVIVLLGGAVTYQLLFNYERTLRDQLEAKGVAMARSVAARGADLILTNQRYSLYELAREVQRSDEDVAYVFVADREGNPVVHTFGSGFPAGLLELESAPGPEGYRMRRLATEAGVIQDIAVPILDGRGGYVHVGMSERRIRTYVNENIVVSVMIIGGVLFLGSAGAYGLATVLTRPVERLVDATEAVGRGDFTRRAPVWATDEIGRLGEAFNAMTDQLRQSSEALLRRNRDLEALFAVASAANHSREAAEVMELALEQVTGALNANAAWLLLLDEDSGSLTPVAQKGLPEDLANALSPLDRRECACLRSAGGRPLAEVVQGCAVLKAHPALDAERARVACVPLRSKGRPLGVLNVLCDAGRELDEAETELLVAIADQVAVAVENARLVEELREKEALRGQLLEQVIAAQEEERKRIARELHDETAQALTSLSVSLKGLEASGLPDEVRKRLADIQTVAADAVRAVHDLSFELRPSVLDDAGLGPAIERYVREFSARHGLPVDVQITGLRERLPAVVETALYRIAQEALTNVARHANATHASVLLERRDGVVLLVVEDNGKGMSRRQLAADSRDHLGIHGMQERATLVGGTLTIESAPGAGCSVYVEVPLEGASREQDSRSSRR
ncbi:MAG TPA: HAMP domain-containing protein [Dehalococcoidia bacterium]|nr:HAMP domain-containing protein [Dehalococcoidia bacterium]